MIEDILECELHENLIAPSAQYIIKELEKQGLNEFEIAKLMSEETISTSVSLHGTGDLKGKIFKAVLNELYSIICENNTDHNDFRQKIKGHLGETIAAVSGYIAAKLGVEDAILLPIIVTIVKGIRNVSGNVTCEILLERIEKYK